MLTPLDLRLVELRLLEHLAGPPRPTDVGTWHMGVLVSAESGQAADLKISLQTYADMILTLVEDGYLHPTDERILSMIASYTGLRAHPNRTEVRDQIWASSVFLRMSISYRGLRRIDELREQLRRDRVLERFGILLDGRYIVSDLIRYLEEAEGQPMSVIFADIDDFKCFNEDHNYQAGDAVLRHVFSLVKHSVGGRGEVYRRGGDEIIAVLPYFTLDKSNALAERVRREVADTVCLHDGQELRVSLSIGVAASPPCDPDGPRLEVLAGNAAKRAKAAGKNCVSVFTP